MNFRAFVAVAALAAAAVPAAVRAQNFQFAQADFLEPTRPEEALDSKIAADATELALLKDAYVHIENAVRERASGNVEKTMEEDKAAADNLVRFVNRYPNHRLRIVLLRMAALRYLGAKQWEAAAEAAQRIIQDPKALPVSKAIGARYAAGAWQMLAVTDMKSGKIPPLRLVTSGARGGAAPSPRKPDRPWAMFVEAADTYEKNYDADPANKLTGEERKAQGGADLGQLELIAAQVEFGYDNIEDAQRRFRKVIETQPDRIDLLESAVPYYLDTFKILKDPKGLEAALAKVEPELAAGAKQAAERAAAPGASEEAKKAAAAYAKLATEIKDSAKGGDYNAGADLLAKGDALAKAGNAEGAAAQYRQAAEKFEAYAASNKESPDAAAALFNAALAWDRAKEGKKAIADREKLLDAYPDAKVAQQTTVILGGTLAAARNYADSAKYNQQYLTRWPDGPQRCAVRQNLGVAYQETKKTAEAVQAYLSFANDPVCAGEDPNTTVRILYSTAKLQADLKKTADAKKTLQQIVAVKGVTDVVAKSYQDDAKKRLAAAK